ncbi:MAG: response regulator transcription factor [Chthoniobacteraceae bacterium]
MKRVPAQDVLIVDDDRMTRQQLHAHLQRHARWRVCGEAADLATAERLARTTPPAFVVLELPLAGTSDADALAALHACAPRAQFVVIGEDDGFAWQQRVFAAGARGVVQRNDAPEAVVLALAQVAEGALYASPHAVQQVLAHLHAPARAAHLIADAKLSAREREVLALLGEGFRRQAIAQRLGRSPKTIETHQEHLKEKLRVETFEELLPIAQAYAAALGRRT